MFEEKIRIPVGDNGFYLLNKASDPNGGHIPSDVRPSGWYCPGFVYGRNAPPRPEDIESHPESDDEMATPLKQGLAQTALEEAMRPSED